MQINQSFAESGRGYVRAVYSKRARGFAVPVDLLRVHCRALMWSGSRGRVRDAFAGYLVGVESGPGVVGDTWLESVRDCAVRMGPGPYGDKAARGGV